MSKVRINDLAREMEVKSRSILDALTAVGVTEPKTHSSSIEADEAEKVRNYFQNQRRGGGSSARAAVETKPAFDLSHISKPGDAMKAILARKQAEADARSRPAVAAPRPVAPAPTVAAPAAKPVVQAASAPVRWRLRLLRHRGEWFRCRGRARRLWWLRRLRRLRVSLHWAR